MSGTGRAPAPKRTVGPEPPSGASPSDAGVQIERSLAPSKEGRRAFGGTIRFRVLGPLEVDAGADPIPLGGRKQRGVLAVLIARANEFVPTETLIDEIWGDDPPDTARNVIHTYISHLRKALGYDRIEGGPPGYRLRLDPSELDSARFDALVRDATKAMPVDPALAVGTLEDALALWRGPAMGDLPDSGSLLAEAGRLDELRLEAQQDRIEGLMATGAHTRAIGELEVLLTHHPLREGLWTLLVLALYREGRQAEALTAYQRAREILADELGIDPSPELVRLHEQVLRQDPQLDLRGEPLRGYRLLEQIGEGAVGTVFRAIQPHVGRDVAVKIVHERIAASSSFVRTFEPRAQAAATLEHPHIAPVDDYWREPGRAYIVSRYLRGGSLRALKERGEELEPQHGARILEQIASALASAHRQGVAHGHVYPANVLFDEEENAYLGDFAVGTGQAPTPADDVRDLAALSEDLLPSVPWVRELAERVELGEGVVVADDFVRAARTTPGGRAPSRLEPGEERNPYKGLRAFSEADAPDFFGRGALTKRLVSRLNESGPGSRFLAVVGPSGGGKSSVVNAGLVPAIRNGALAGMDGMFITEMLPGAHPIDELESSLLRIAVSPVPRLGQRLESGSRGLLDAIDLVTPRDAELLLVVDQLEEVFTLTTTEAERELFLESLRVAVADPRSRLRVIVTLRADFYDRPLTYPRLGELLAARTEAVPPLTPDELEQAIRRPAEQLGISAERGLVAEMIGDVAHQPGGLPLLEYALTELFERREADQLTLSAYREIGGVAGALSARAERILETTDEAGRRAAKQVFLRLVTLGEGRHDTRRRVARRELDSLGVDEETIDAVLDSFGRHRLLTFDREPSTREPTVEVAHEALLTAWARLAAWIDRARDDLRQNRGLAQAGAEWRGSGKEPSFLLRGARLDQVENWARNSDLRIGQPEREYLQASIVQRERERRAEEERRRHEAELEQRSVRRLRGLVAVLSMAAVVAASLTLIATDQRERAGTEASRAEREALISGARELAAASVSNLQFDPELSILLAMEAIDRTRSVDGSILPEAEDALHQAIGANRVERTLPGVGGSAVWSTHGTFAAASAEERGSVEIRDGETGAIALRLAAHDGHVTGLAFSPDGGMLATTGSDGHLNVWDASTGERLSSVRGVGDAQAPTFDRDGSRIAAAWRGDLLVRIAIPETGRILRTFAAAEGDITFSPDLRRLGIVDPPKTFVLDLRTGRQARGAGLGEDGPLSWSPDGQLLAGYEQGRVTVFDAATLRSRFSLVHNEAVQSMGWSLDSDRLVTGGRTTAKVWEVGEDGPRELMTLAPRFPGGIGEAELSPDGSRVITGDAEGLTVKIWDVSISGDAEVANIPATRDFYSDVAFMPDGTRVAVTLGRDLVIRIWDLGERRTVREIGPPRLGVARVYEQEMFEVSPDGAAIATVNGAGAASIWDVATGQEIFTVPKTNLITSANWSRDGSQIAMSSLHGWAKVFNRSGREIGVLREPDGSVAWGAEFTPDGRFVVLDTGPKTLWRRDPDGRTTIWDVERGEVVRTIEGAGGTWSATSPTGDRHVTTDPWGRGPADLWSLETGERVARLVDEGMTTAEFGPDGSRIAGGMEDATVRLFDAASGDQGLVLRGHEDLLGFVDFSPDGSMLVSSAADGVVRVWALDIDVLLQIARDEVTRSLTDKECRQYLHVEACDTSP